ncbi:MAG: hypothetical protein WCZ89_03215 [Phycisphaerae bacterium]
MKLPKLQKPDKYTGLYIVDFGEHSGVGFTAEEVAELLESEKFRGCKVYKIHNAYPDGRLELKGVSPQTFQLESGMFFFSGQSDNAKGDFERLVNLAVAKSPPCRAKVHLAKLADDKYAAALIYPAEYDDQISDWLIRADFKTQGPVEAGISAVTSYYDLQPVILERHQLFAETEWQNRTGDELLAATKIAVQR